MHITKYGIHKNNIPFYISLSQWNMTSSKGIPCWAFAIRKDNSQIIISCVVVYYDILCKLKYFNLSFLLKLQTIEHIPKKYNRYA